MHVQVLRPQRISQRFGFLTPFIIQLFMVQHRNHRLIAQGCEVINLKQFVAQDVVVANAVDHCRHQRVDELAGCREAVDANTVFGLAVEHDVVQVITVMPQAEFGAHTVMADR